MVGARYASYWPTSFSPSLRKIIGPKATTVFMITVEITTVKTEKNARQKLHFLLWMSLYECLLKN